MIHQPIFRTMSFFVTVFLFAFPVSFASSQSDGATASGDTPVTSARDAGMAPAVPEKATTTEVAPSAIPTSTAPSAAPTAPRGTITPAPTPEPVSSSGAENEIPSPPAPVPPPPQNSNFLFPALVLIAATLLIALYGMRRLLADSKKEKPEDKNENRCDDIKRLLERKKSTLATVSGTISAKQILVDLLLKKIEEKKEELEDEIKEEVIDKTAGEEGGKVIRTMQETKDAYDELVEKSEQAKRAIEYFSDRRKLLEQEVSKIESAYELCMAGDSVASIASRLGEGVPVFSAASPEKLYRYTSQGEGVFSIGKRFPPKYLAEEADAARKWLPCPELPEGEYQYFFTEKGKEEYEKTLLPVHKKYLSDIQCEEAGSPESSRVAYEDEWQTIVRT